MVGVWEETGWLAGWLERDVEVRWVCVEMSGGSLGVCWEGDGENKHLLLVLVLVSVLGGGHRRGACCLESLLFVLVFVARRVSGEERRERGGCGRALWCWERDGVACL